MRATVERLAALVTFTVFLATAFRAGWTRSETDFPNYFTAAVLVREGQPLRKYYDWTWFARQMNHAGFERQIGSYAAQTPLTMLPMVELAALPPQRAKQVWLTLNLGFLLATLWLLSRVTRFRIEQVWLVAFCAYFSLYSNFLLGQYYVFLLFLLTLAFYCLHRTRSASGGFVAAFAFGLKLYGGPFLVYFAAKRNWKAVAGMLAAVACLGALAIALFGLSDIHYYLRQILPRSLEGGSIDPYSPGNPTLGTALRRLFMREPELNPLPPWNAPWLFFFLRTLTALGVLAFTALGLGADRSTNQRRGFAWFMVAVIVLSTSTASYTSILLVLPLVLVLEESGQFEGAFLVALYVLLAYPLGLRWLFPKVWLLLGLYAALGRHYLRSLRPRLVVATALAIAIVAFVDAQRHMASFRNEPGQRFERVAVEKGALFSSSPAISEAGLFYQSMGGDGYVLRWSHDDRIETLRPEGQALHPVAPTADGPVYFELVAHGTSTTMQFDPTTRRVSAAPRGISTEERDSVASPDGRWIAYGAVVTGSRQIWLRNVATGMARPLTAGNCNSSSPAWELDSRSIIFSSDCGRAFGLPALYRARVPDDRQARS
jgi:hypothetical protein